MELPDFVQDAVVALGPDYNSYTNEQLKAAAPEILGLMITGKKKAMGRKADHTIQHFEPTIDPKTKLAKWQCCHCGQLLVSTFDYNTRMFAPSSMNTHIDKNQGCIYKRRIVAHATENPGAAVDEAQLRQDSRLQPLFKFRDNRLKEDPNHPLLNFEPTLVPPKTSKKGSSTNDKKLEARWKCLHCNEPLAVVYDRGGPSIGTSNLKDHMASQHTEKKPMTPQDITKKLVALQTRKDDNLKLEGTDDKRYQNLYHMVQPVHVPSAGKKQEGFGWQCLGGCGKVYMGGAGDNVACSFTKFEKHFADGKCTADGHALAVQHGILAALPGVKKEPPISIVKQAPRAVSALYEELHKEQLPKDFLEAHPAEVVQLDLENYKKKVEMPGKYLTDISKMDLEAQLTWLSTAQKLNLEVNPCHPAAWYTFVIAKRNNSNERYAAYSCNLCGAINAVMKERDIDHEGCWKYRLAFHLTKGQCPLGNVVHILQKILVQDTAELQLRYIALGLNSFPRDFEWGSSVELSRELAESWGRQSDIDGQHGINLLRWNHRQAYPLTPADLGVAEDALEKEGINVEDLIAALDAFPC